MKITVHMLTDHGFSRINRGSSGDLKTAVYGGSTRLRISSQCQKYDWKVQVRKQAALDNKAGFGAVRLSAQSFLKSLLEQDFLTDKERDYFFGGDPGVDNITVKKETPAGKFINLIWEVKDESEKAKAERLKKAQAEGAEEVSDAKEEAGKNLLFLTEDEFQTWRGLCKRIAQGARFADKGNKTTSGILDLEGERAIDLFGEGDFLVSASGRMIAVNKAKSVDAASWVQNAIGITPMDAEDDYFTAIDDLKKDQGAGMLGTAQYATGIVYQHLKFDVDLLAENLGKPKAEVLDNLAYYLGVILSRPLRSEGAETLYAVIETTQSNRSTVQEATFEDPKVVRHLTASGAVTRLRDAIDKSRRRYSETGTVLEWGRLSENDPSLAEVLNTIKSL
jgi:CRISPR system Cascade subunit CasC